MQIFISVSAQTNITVEDVLKRIAYTIKMPDGSPGTYAHRGSCHAEVARYLKRHIGSWDPNWRLMIFGDPSNTNADFPAHSCLYDDAGKVIADSFRHEGNVVSRGGKVFYQTHVTYPLHTSMRSSTFKREYLS